MLPMKMMAPDIYFNTAIFLIPINKRSSVSLLSIAMSSSPDGVSDFSDADNDDVHLFHPFTHSSSSFATLNCKASTRRLQHWYFSGVVWLIMCVRWDVTHWWWWWYWWWWWPWMMAIIHEAVNGIGLAGDGWILHRMKLSFKHDWWHKMFQTY